MCVFNCISVIFYDFFDGYAKISILSKHFFVTFNLDLKYTFILVFDSHFYFNDYHLHRYALK